MPQISPLKIYKGALLFAFWVPRTAPKSTSCRGGFTLIELLVVLAIMSAVVALSVSRINNRNTELRATVRKLSVLSREIHTHARLQGATYRLVINIPEDSNEPHSYWVESSHQKILLPKDRTDIRQPPPESDEEDTTSLKGFQVDNRILRRPQELPSYLEFSSVEIGGYEQPLTEGLIYIHYFPQGLVEEAAIYISAGPNLNWTLAIHPLTGKADIIPNHLSLKEIREQ